MWTQDVSCASTSHTVTYTQNQNKYLLEMAFTNQFHDCCFRAHFFYEFLELNMHQDAKIRLLTLRLPSNSRNFTMPPRFCVCATGDAIVSDDPFVSAFDIIAFFNSFVFLLWKMRSVTACLNNLLNWNSEKFRRLFVVNLKTFNMFQHKKVESNVCKFLRLTVVLARTWFFSIALCHYCHKHRLYLLCCAHTKFRLKHFPFSPHEHKHTLVDPVSIAKQHKCIFFLSFYFFFIFLILLLYICWWQQQICLKHAQQMLVCWLSLTYVWKIIWLSFTDWHLLSPHSMKSMYQPLSVKETTSRNIPLKC